MRPRSFPILIIYGRNCFAFDSRKDSRPASRDQGLCPPPTPPPHHSQNHTILTTLCMYEYRSNFMNIFNETVNWLGGFLLSNFLHSWHEAFCGRSMNFMFVFMVANFADPQWNEMLRRRHRWYYCWIKQRELGFDIRYCQRKASQTNSIGVLLG